MKPPSKTTYSGKYEVAMKIAIAREYLTSDLGFQQLSTKYNIPRSTVRLFVKWYKQKYPDGVVPPEALDKVKDSPHQPSDTELKLLGFQLLIENASKELGVDLVKKFGTKQSDK